MQIYLCMPVCAHVYQSLCEYMSVCWAMFLCEGIHISEHVGILIGMYVFMFVDACLVCIWAHEYMCINMFLCVCLLFIDLSLHV